MRIVVIGAGVGGLGAATTLSKQGHEIVVIEHDDTPLPADADGAFDWDRTGAPQVRHSHAFLARLRNLLRDRHPELLAELMEAGATDMDFIAMLPEDMDRTPMDGDEDLVALSCRRTTFEWVLRRHVLALDHVELRHGHPVVALLSQVGPDGPVVCGVRLDDGTEIEADLVVAAGGRRFDVPALVAPLGVEVVEQVQDTGIVYFSRFFRLAEGQSYPPQVGPIGGDLGHLKFGVFHGDNQTFSITLATSAGDDEMRSMLMDGENFLTTAASLPATAAYVDGRADPITDVYVMARLVNRGRRFTDDDHNPLVPGLVAVGDAHTCTNPLYGRGCALAMVQAELVADAIAATEDSAANPTEICRRYEADCVEQIRPWYRAAVAQDNASRAEAERLRSADASSDTKDSSDSPPSGADEAAEEEFSTRALMRDGLFPAMRSDPVVLRAFLRMFNLLEAPDSLITNTDVIGRVMVAYQDRHNRPEPPPGGPDRAAMLAASGVSRPPQQG